MITTTRIPVLGFAAFSGTGKTNLLRQVILLLRTRGLRLGIIKHSHHAFEIDKPNKDSHTLRQAGAVQMLVCSTQRTVMLKKHQRGERITLQHLLQRFDTSNLDIILVEGFKCYPIPKIELYRSSLGRPLLCGIDPAIIAVATDAPLPTSVTLPVLELNRPIDIADFIQKRFLGIDSLSNG